MASSQPEDKRNRTHWLLWQRVCLPVRYFLTDTVLPTVGMVLILLLFLLALPLYIPLMLLTEVFERYRRLCPVHNERFQFEVFEISFEEAELNRKRKQVYLGIVRPVQSVSFTRLEEREFPYANDGIPDFSTPKRHSRRFCPECRAVKKGYIERGEFPTFERTLWEVHLQFIGAQAQGELEALEQRLGLTVKRPEQVLDETLGNAEGR